MGARVLLVAAPVILAHGRYTSGFGIHVHVVKPWQSAVRHRQWACSRSLHEEGAFATSSSIEVFAVGPVNLGHEGANCRRGLAEVNNKVHVVGHENPRDDARTGLLARLFEQPEVAPTISIVLKERHLSRAPHDNVIVTRLAQAAPGMQTPSPSSGGYLYPQNSQRDSTPRQRDSIAGEFNPVATPRGRPARAWCAGPRCRCGRRWTGRAPARRRASTVPRPSARRTSASP